MSCWEVAPNGESQPQAQTMMDGPVLDTAWSDDGSKVFCAGADKTAKIWDLGSNSLSTVGEVIAFSRAVTVLCRRSLTPTIRAPTCALAPARLTPGAAIALVLPRRYSTRRPSKRATGCRSISC